ncbi:MAG: ATP-binding protein [Akkermansia sp.]
MISWSIVIGLVLIAFLLPFIYLRLQLNDLKKRQLHDNAEIQVLRRFKADLEEHVENDKSLFLNALGVAFILIRPSGRLVMANKEAGRLLGIDESSNINLLSKLGAHPMREALSNAIAAKKASSSTVRLQIADTDYVYRVTSTPLGNADRHIGIVFHDMTEEHRTMGIRREFVTNASHELRTPLTIIRGYLESFIEDPEYADNKVMRERAFGLMQKHTDRIVRLVEDMLTISRLENAGNEHMRIERFCLDTMLNDVRLRLDRMIQQQEARCSIDIYPRGIEMHGDKFYWEQIIFNLMENSLKNNPKAGLGLELKVKARLLEDKQVQISIIDNGCGILAEAMPYIFKRFYRADQSGIVKGTGLGLSIVRNAVEAQGGTIRAESEPHGRTEFTITAPLDARSSR